MQNEKAFIAQLLNPITQETAFRQLVSDYSRPLYSHIRNMVLDHDDANDVLQNTFIKVFQNLKAFKGESRLFSWVYRIATNEALTYISKKAKKAGITNEEILENTAQTLYGDEYFEGDAIQAKFQLAVASLPEKQQLVFKMKYFEDMKYEDISDILGTSVGGLKASYHHAVKKIEDYINTH